MQSSFLDMTVGMLIKKLGEIPNPTLPVMVYNELTGKPEYVVSVELEREDSVHPGAFIRLYIDPDDQ